MSEIRKKAMTRLMLCAVALVACIIFSVLLLSGTFDGKTGGSKPASGDTISSSAPAEGVDDPTADNFTAESTPAEEAPGPTPVCQIRRKPPDPRAPAPVLRIRLFW